MNTRKQKAKEIMKLDGFVSQIDKGTFRDDQDRLQFLLKKYDNMANKNQSL